MERDGHLADMEMTLEERQQMLVESNRRIEDVEEEQARTQRQVGAGYNHGGLILSTAFFKMGGGFGLSLWDF